MLREIEIKSKLSLADYEVIPQYTLKVNELKAFAQTLKSNWSANTIYMVNSTAKGGGVAEMLPQMIAILKELGFKCKWLVLETDEPLFFSFTKKLHNLIHGFDAGEITAEEIAVYKKVSEKNAEELLKIVKHGDLLYIHDPQPMGAGAIAKRTDGIKAVWRCHIGTSLHNEATRRAWGFLADYSYAYEHGVFSAPEYIPAVFAGRASIVHPALDPLTHKNRELRLHKISGILASGALVDKSYQSIAEPFGEQIKSIAIDGTLIDGLDYKKISLLKSPFILQVSRWDKLKGWASLMQGFAELKANITSNGYSPRQKKRLEQVCLLLAGPEAASVSDDPEATAVFKELIETYVALPYDIKNQIAIITLPMVSKKQNALMVNALQRTSDIVVQNSLQEGFGLTATEAMLKGVPLVVSNAVGLLQQVTNGVHGLVNNEPESAGAVAKVLEHILLNPLEAERRALAAKRRTIDEFLVFTQLKKTLQVLSTRIK